MNDTAQAVQSAPPAAVPGSQTFPGVRFRVVATHRPDEGQSKTIAYNLADPCFARVKAPAGEVMLIGGEGSGLPRVTLTEFTLAIDGDTVVIVGSGKVVPNG